MDQLTHSSMPSLYSFASMDGKNVAAPCFDALTTTFSHSLTLSISSGYLLAISNISCLPEFMQGMHPTLPIPCLYKGFGSMSCLSCISKTCSTVQSKIGLYILIPSGVSSHSVSFDLARLSSALTPCQLTIPPPVFYYW